MTMFNQEIKNYIEYNYDVKCYIEFENTPVEGVAFNFTDKNRKKWKVCFRLGKHQFEDNKYILLYEIQSIPYTQGYGYGVTCEYENYKEILDERIKQITDGLVRKVNRLV